MTTAGTLLAEDFAALDLVEPTEDRFLCSAVRDAVREARREGRYAARFHSYQVSAWREALGARLITVTWRVSRDGSPVASDTHILYA